MSLLRHKSLLYQRFGVRGLGGRGVGSVGRWFGVRVWGGGGGVVDKMFGVKGWGGGDDEALVNRVFWMKSLECRGEGFVGRRIVG